MSEFEKCMKGEPFTCDEEMMNIILRNKKLLKQLNETPISEPEARMKIIKQMFGSVGTGLWIDVDFHCEYGINIHCGNDVIINMNCTFVDNNRINIGNNVLIASDVKIYTATHSTKIAERTQNQEQRTKSGGFCVTYSKPITIEDNVWIGGGAIILPGVTIGNGAVIGAGAVVTKDIPANSIAVGNPARVIKIIEQ